MTYVKKSHTKRYIAIILSIILIGAVGAALYATMSAKPIVAGVHVGDTFTYSLKGYVTLTGLNAVPTEGFSIYNETDYYKVEITDVNGTIVSTKNTWQFLNGTNQVFTESFDISKGGEGIKFWAIYPANLNVNDLLRPNGYDNNIVNNTSPRTYSSGTREQNFWYINNPFSDIKDPTGSTLRYDYMNIFFDRATGMLIQLENYQFYNNPERDEKITWNLTNSTVWQV
jgi:hypothetical protein